MRVPRIPRLAPGLERNPVFFPRCVYSRNKEGGAVCTELGVVVLLLLDTRVWRGFRIEVEGVPVECECVCWVRRFVGGYGAREPSVAYVAPLELGVLVVELGKLVRIVVTGQVVSEIIWMLKLVIFGD